MALMKYREPNQVKWVGTRPGHNGTQFSKSVTVIGAGIDLYQPALGNVGCITNLIMSIYGAAAGTAYLEHTTSADVNIAYIAMNIWAVNLTPIPAIVYLATIGVGGSTEDTIDFKCWRNGLCVCSGVDRINYVKRISRFHNAT